MEALHTAWAFVIEKLYMESQVKAMGKVLKAAGVEALLRKAGV